MLDCLKWWKREKCENDYALQLSQLRQQCTGRQLTEETIKVYLEMLKHLSKHGELSGDFTPEQLASFNNFLLLYKVDKRLECDGEFTTAEKSNKKLVLNVDEYGRSEVSLITTY